MRVRPLCAADSTHLAGVLYRYQGGIFDRWREIVLADDLVARTKFAAEASLHDHFTFFMEGFMAYLERQAAGAREPCRRKNADPDDAAGRSASQRRKARPILIAGIKITDSLRLLAQLRTAVIEGCQQELHDVRDVRLLLAAVDQTMADTAAKISQAREARDVRQEVTPSERNFRLLAEASPQIIWTAKPDLQADYFNGQWFAYTGRGPEETYEDCWAEAIHPADAELTAAAWARAANSSTLFEVEHRIMGKDASYRWFLSRAVPVNNGLGEVERWLGASTDIEDQRRAHVELSRAKSATEAAERAKSAFFSIMSHEIRTPLSAIVGFGVLLKEEGLAPEDLHSFADAITRNGRELGRLIDDILDLSKMEAGHVDIERLAVDVPGLLDDVAATLMPKALQKGITLTIRADSDVPEVITTDPTRLRQILLNIIGNAVKFTDQGGVAVKVALDLGKDCKRLLRFTVEDTGAGVSEAAQARLFQLFVLGDATTTRRYGGTGLGLVLARKLALAMGGDVTLAASLAGQGSTFIATIDPGCAAVPGSAPSGTHKPRVGCLDFEILTGVRVLFAEDSPDNQVLISRILRKAGASVEVVSDGAQAVERAITGNPDIFLTDIEMPILDGYDAATELRRRGFKKPIIALTAYDMLGARDKCLRVGCDEHLTKPVSRKRLVYAVARCAARGRSQDEMLH